MTRLRSARVSGPWTLRAKLVTAVVALFLVVTAVTGAFTVVALRSSLTQQLDDDLQQIALRAGGGGGFPGDSDQDQDQRRGGGPGPLPGGGARTLRLVTDSDGTVVVNEVDEGFDTTPLTDAQVELLLDAGIGRNPRSLDLGDDAGSYRLVSQSTSDGSTIITGLPRSGLDAAVQQVTLAVLASTAVGLLLVAVGGTFLVRRTLEPLDRIASTATRVSQLPLDSGSVALAERVPDADTDPRTEVGQVGLALNEMLDHIGSALESRHESEMRVRQFVADASHELRTPLASIRGYAELSRREPEPVPSSVVHALSRVESEAIRMTGLVEDLLLLARLDAGRPLDREPVDLTLLVIDAVGDARAASPDHRWLLDLPEEAVEVPGDAARLHQAVVNLLANARTHTPEGTDVTTAVRAHGGGVRVSVSDNGPGIPQSLQRNVFQRFTRGDDSRSRAAGSTGLGLSIVWAVVAAHGGTVELESRPGATTFSVVLPA